MLSDRQRAELKRKIDALMDEARTSAQRAADADPDRRELIRQHKDLLRWIDVEL